MSELIVRQIGDFSLKSYGPITLLGHWWTWTPYDKCSFRCVYCSVEAQGKSRPNITHDEIGSIFVGFKEHQGKFPLELGITADAYPPEEAEHQLTRRALAEIRKHDIRFAITTHGDLVARDIDLLTQCPSLEGVGISIPHRDPAMIRRFESGAPDFESRRRAVYQLYEAGIPVHINISPWIPGITDADAIAREFPENMTVNVGALSYNEKQQALTREFFGRETASAKRVFAKSIGSQADINQAYIEAFKTIGKGSRGNLNWLAPPNMEQSIITKLSSE